MPCYINTLPLRLPFQLKMLTSPFNFILDIPTVLNKKLDIGQIDVSLSSSAAYLKGSYSLISGFGIASTNEILSVNLYLNGDIKSGKIGLSHHSEASCELLKVICSHFWQVSPEFVPLDRSKPFTDYDGFLLIGDEALKNQTIPGYVTIDLAKEWYKYTNLPFVFALLYSKEILNLDCLPLEKALQWSEKNLDLVVEYAQKTVSIPSSLIYRYYTVCKYRLGDIEYGSLELFAKLMER